MDNLTHTLTGLALARAGLNRLTPGATAILLVSANLPDIDVVALLQGQLTYLEAHRGYTHSLLCLPLMAALSVLIASAFTRRRLSMSAGFILACIGIASHLWLDWTTSYGIRLLLPFSSRWFHLDWEALTDYPSLVVLAFAAVWPYFARLVMREIGARRPFGRVLPVVALALFGAVQAMRAVTHTKAIAQLNTVLYDDRPALETAALPGSSNPWLWGAIVETDRSYLQSELNLLTESEPVQWQTYLKPPRDMAIEAALKTEPFRFFQYFARFPAWLEQPGSTAGPRTTRIDLSDLRFGEPGAGSFHCIALVDAGGRVLESTFTFGDGAELGWAGDVRMKQK